MLVQLIFCCLIFVINSQNADILSRLGNTILVLIIMEKDLPSIKKVMVAAGPMFTKEFIFSLGRPKPVSMYNRY